MSRTNNGFDSRNNVAWISRVVYDTHLFAHFLFTDNAARVVPILLFNYAAHQTKLSQLHP